MSRFVSRAGELVADLVDRSAEAGRLSRGRALFRKGSVSDLSVVEGSIIATVRGSKGDEYETTIDTVLASPGVKRQFAEVHDPENRRSVDDLIDDGLAVGPQEIDLAFVCDCADWEEPCKHVVAVLLAFADRVDLDEVDLLRWRGLDSQSAADSDAPMESLSTDRVQLAEADDRSARLSELESLLGDTVMRVSRVSDSDPAPSAPAIEPALAEFLGVGVAFDPVDLSGIVALEPLFDGVQLGPLTDLGPELAVAVAAIMTRLEGVLPD